MNIVSLIMQFLAPAIVNKLASSLGINSAIAQKVLAAAVPAILAGILGKSAQPSGAGALFGLLSKQDSGMLGNFANILGGSQQASVAQQGMSALGGLLGNSSLGALTSAIGKFGGTDEKATTGIVGMLAPAILGTLAQQQKSSGLDAAGLASMLAGQKDNIASALPGDFAKMLGGSGLLDGLGSSLTSMGPSSTSASRVEAAPAKAGFNWMPWALAAVLAGLGWYWFAGRTPPQVAIPKPPQIMVGTTNVADQFGGVMNTLRNSMASVKDAASAQAALPRLREAQGELDRLGGLAAQLTGDNKKNFASYVSSWLPLINPLISSMLGNSAIGPVVKPVIDGLTSRLTAMAKP